MKIATLLCFFISVFFVSAFSEYANNGKPGNQKIICIFNQEPFGRPLANREDYFWKDRKYFDTVEITSRHLFNLFQQNLLTLKKSSFFDIDHQAALIIIKEGRSTDTLYSDYELHYWKHKQVVYEDTTNFFYNKLFNFFDKSNAH